MKHLDEYRLYLDRARDVCDPSQYMKAAPCMGYKNADDAKAFLGCVMFRHNTRGERLKTLALEVLDHPDEISIYPADMRELLAVLAERLPMDAAPPKRKGKT